MAIPDRLNPALRDLPVYVPGRPLEDVAREIGTYPEHLIKVASNENPLGPSPIAVIAMNRVAEEMNRYPDGNATQLRKDLAEHHRMQPDNLVFGNGSNEIIEFLAHALLGPGDDVVVSQYCFAIYPIVTKMMGANVIEVPAKELAHDLDAMLTAITPQTKIMFVANPNNPTGTQAREHELETLIDAIPEDVMLVLDQAYAEYQEEHQKILERVRSGNHPNLILMRTFSKIYGLAGLRVGYGMGHPEFIAALEKIRQPFNLNAMAQAAAQAALKDTLHVDSSRDQNRKGSIYFAIAFERAGIRYQRSGGNFILIHVENGAAITEELKQLGIIVRPMDSYGLPEWIRYTLGSDSDNRRFHQAICQVLNRPED
ncbi:MAG: histidinol-phosphate transaminase [Verrucomicrobiales bacterium]|nr:histidinol-phosphate transaminase [Verrucomicrobiales bacterium]